MHFVYGRTSVPIGGDAQTSGRFDPAFALFLPNTLSDVCALGYNLGVRWGTSEASEGPLEPEAGGVLHARAVDVRDAGSGRLRRAFRLEGRESNVSIDAGATFLVHPRVRLDVFSGFGVTPDATDFFAGGGISFRVPD